MINQRIFFWVVVLFFAGFYGLPSSVLADEKQIFPIGYLELGSDPRYKEQQVKARFQGQPWGRPFIGAELALREVRFAASAVGVKFELQRHQGADLAAMQEKMAEMLAAGVKFIFIDAPGDVVAALAKQVKGKDVLLFNLTSTDQTLRETHCQSNLMHPIPDQTMLMDALAQYLISKKWRKVIVLKGTTEKDEKIHAALTRSAKRFGLKVIATKAFELGNDPRERSKNNVKLLTSGKDYDVVLVVDGGGEFARDVPYQIQKPRPVVGSAGLVPDGWIWAWERHGAPQLNNRFLKKADRPMTAYDWSAWVSIKVIAEAVLRTQGTDFSQLRDFIQGTDIVIDGFKGYPLSFRDWNRQLRQPIFLTTTNWVVARAPLDGFLHNKNNLDTLGLDRNETRCE